MTWLQCGDGPILAPEPGVLRSWQLDRRPCYAIVLVIESPAVEARRRAVWEALRPWLTSPPPAHVTIHVRGTRHPQVPRDRLDVTVGGADSFAAAAFLHADGDHLHRLRDAALARHGPEVDPAPTWTPHVTVGTYSEAPPAHEVAARLAPLRSLPDITVSAKLAAVDVRAFSRTSGVPG